MQLLNKKVSLICCWILFSSISFAQLIDFSFDHLGEEEGLTHHTYNNFVTKDSRGFFWISSMNGCFRFDGNHLKHYDINRDSINPSDENIQSLFFEDRNNDLWVTTYNALHCYRRTNDSFEKFRIEHDSILNANYHAFHFQDRFNKLWLRAEEQIWTFNTETNEAKQIIKNTKGVRFTVDTTDLGELSRILAFPYNTNGFEIWTKRNDGSWDLQFIEDGVFSYANIKNGFFENDSLLWLVSNVGLIEYNYRSTPRGKVKTHSIPDKNSTKELTSGIWYQTNTLILASSGTGLWSFDTYKKTFKQNWKASAFDLRNALSFNSPIKLNLTSDGTLWVTHTGIGLDYTQAGSLFKNPLARETPLPKVESIIEDNKNRIWVHSVNNGIYIFDIEGQLQHQVRDIYQDKDFSKSRLSIDEQKKIWLIFKNNVYLLKESAHTSNKKSWRNVYSTKDKLISLYHGIPENTIITSVNGIYFLSKNKNSTSLDFPPFSKQKNGEFNYFFKGNDEITFAPYDSKQLISFSYENEKLLQLGTLELNTILYDLLQTKGNNQIWLATNNGLFHVEDDKKTAISVIDKIDFNINLPVYTILRPENGLLWLSASNGIWSYNSKAQELVKFMVSDKNQYSPNNGLVASNGHIWFGGNKGLSIFDPSSDLLKASKNPDVYIEQLLIDDRPYKSDKRVNDIKSIDLDHSNNSISIELRAIVRKENKQAKISYRLKNQNDSWNKISNGEKITFSNLLPGHYQLQAKLASPNLKSSILKTIDITITPPFWKTTWFKLLVLLSTISLIVFGLVRVYYIKELKKQKQLLEKQKTINTERNRIAKELHDDIGGGLSSILFISEDLSQGGENESKTEQVNRISELTREALTNMKDIIWALDNNQNTLQDLLSRIHTYSNRFLSDHQIELQYDASIPPKQNIQLSSQKKRNILLIAKECLHNIAKHAKASKVNIEVSNDQTQFIFIIIDNGIGFDQATLQSKGHGLENIIHRTGILNGQAEIQSSPSKGCKIKIVIPL